MYFPKDNIPLEKKNRSWLLEWGQAIYAWHINNGNPENFPRAKYAELARYMHGNQEVMRHKPNANPLRNNNNVLNWGTNWRNLKIGFSFLNAVHGKLNKIKIYPEIVQIDSFANDRRRDFELRVRRIMEAKNEGIETAEFIQSMGLNPEEFPQSSDELEIFLMTHPIVYEQVEMQSAMAGVFQNSDLETVRREVRWDLLALGIGGIRVDTQNKVTTFRRVNPLNAGTNICKSEDFRDMRFSYEIIQVAPENIRKVAGDAFTKEQYDNIEATAGLPINQAFFYNGVNASVGVLYGEKYNYVVDFEVISTCSLGAEIIQKENGQYRTYIKERPAGSEKGNRTVIREEPQYVFKGKFIIGTDYIYDYGFATQVRQKVPVNPADMDLANPGKAESGFKWFMPNLIYGTSTSMLEMMLPFIDNAQKTWDQITNAIFRLVPQGISIDIDAISNIVLGKGNKMEAADVISLLVQHGIDIYASSAYKGMPNTSANKGVQFKENTATNSIVSLLNIFTAQYNLIAEMTGVTAAVKGGAQSPEIGKGVTEMLATGTDNVLEGVINAEIKLAEKVCYHMMLVAQNYGLKANYKGKTYRIDPQVHGLNIYNSKVKVLPSPGEWARLYDTVDKFAAENMINPEDAVLIRKIDDYDQAYLQFAASRKKKERETTKMQIANQEATFKGQAEVAAQSAEAEKQKVKVETEAKIAEIKAKAREDRLTLLLKSMLEKGSVPDGAKDIVDGEILQIGLNNLVDLPQEPQPEPEVDLPPDVIGPEEEEPVEQMPEEQLL